MMKLIYMFLHTKKFLLLLVVPILLIGLIAGLSLTQKSQEIRKKAATPKVTFNIFPADESFKVGEIKSFEIKATFSDINPSIRLDYIKTEVIFDNNYLEIPKGRYVDTSSTGFGKVIRVDGPMVANQNGKIIIELGVVTPDSGPTVEKPLTVGKIYFMAKNITSNRLEIKLGKTQMGSKGKVLTIPLDDNNSKGTGYTVTSASDTSVPAVEITITATPPVYPSESLPSPTIFNRPTQPTQIKETVFASPTFRPTIIPSPTLISTRTETVIPTPTDILIEKTPTQTISPTTAYVSTEQISPTVYQKIIEVSPTEFPFESLNYITPTPAPKNIFALFDMVKLLICGLLKKC